MNKSLLFNVCVGFVKVRRTKMVRFYWHMYVFVIWVMVTDVNYIDNGSDDDDDDDGDGDDGGDYSRVCNLY